MEKRILIYIVLVITVVFSGTVYGIMLNQDEYNEIDLSSIDNMKVIGAIDLDKLEEENLEIDFIMKETGLNKEESEYLLEKSEKKNLDLFLLMGMIKVESNFNKRLVGSQGERGLGQIMDGTARALAHNLALDYSPNMLFDAKYNINLFTTHLSYLLDVFDNDIHKALTAYNRGENGLKRYIASRGEHRNPAASVYSNRVIQYRNMYEDMYYKDK